MGISHVLIRPMRQEDCDPLSELLRLSRPEYMRFLRLFPVEAEEIRSLVGKAVRDGYFAIEVAGEPCAGLAGIYTLRGLDDGFADWMYGIFVAEPFSGKSIARLTLAHAHTTCLLNGCPRLLLKVDPANERAYRLYRGAGFEFERIHPPTGEHVLTKSISSGSSANQ
ncbi:MAG: Protein N-acetyltransferase, RimJ/RimL family [Verrucomicrobia bacterium]|jgi:RimJ/RimL family protein N-acetyltransferase|nr:MAG: Protein N-acetyltransferase, RimJ/RimL family [Verrucomicrobiota bacterium]